MAHNFGSRAATRDLDRILDEIEDGAENETHAVPDAPRVERCMQESFEYIDILRESESDVTKALSAASACIGSAIYYRYTDQLRAVWLLSEARGHIERARSGMVRRALELPSSIDAVTISDDDITAANDTIHMLRSVSAGYVMIVRHQIMIEYSMIAAYGKPDQRARADIYAALECVRTDDKISLVRTVVAAPWRDRETADLARIYADEVVRCGSYGFRVTGSKISSNPCSLNPIGSPTRLDHQWAPGRAGGLFFSEIGNLFSQPCLTWARCIG